MASVDSQSILPGRLTGAGMEKVAVVHRKSTQRLFFQAKLTLHPHGSHLLPLFTFVMMMAISSLLFDSFSANPTSVTVADASPWYDDMDDAGGDENYNTRLSSRMGDDSVESRYEPVSGDSSANSPFGNFRIDFRAGTGKMAGRRRGHRRVSPAARGTAILRRMRIELITLVTL
ncbi:hypothetical protein TGGT1_298820 [Toxoplasma gondii GT1]|uniref:Uncharacterized protein n=6 Tax=Toxoplasma gondii TaxID=5811 RepID=S7UMG1_TOXGG|nr:hypothetical protein TGGT1_298820 [Toxoplasma gondii GT1]KFG27860.1 hypothetical protein TGP89_298820 [Toxoplasma gondii p89]KFG31944.1 hypothetical protein TGFOU_298820 [Toxoplasma gondii FOU]KFG99369.1 hypothetical protein TGVAND_298820 [Toxoplasma gondii VAND]PIL98171.1 hypothetical protein TGCOUG_298820 [Toxoplasma gondii COUG]RQX68443.1 hypothetical protein TGCAST_298820 [Toxoplasma gondii CAST]